MTKDVGHWMNGRVTPGRSGRYGDIFNPAVGEKSGRVAFASREEVDAAVRAAHEALPKWSAMTPLRRARIMFRFKDLIEQAMDELALLGKQPPVIQQPGQLTLTRPADVAVLEQGDRVVGYWPHHRILKIDHRQLTVVHHHEIAAVEIPVHHNLRLLQGIRNKNSREPFKDLIPSVVPLEPE